MGMFDDVTCEAPLPKIPGAPDPGKCFQTKDFDCQMDHYTITVDGRLLGPIGFVDFHGWLSLCHFDTQTGTWWNYKAKFTDGILQRIDPITIYRHGPPKEPGVPRDPIHFYPPPARASDS